MQRKLHKCFICIIYVGPVQQIHNNSANTSTQWVQHVSDKFTCLINKSTHLINRFICQSQKVSLTANKLPCSYLMSQFAGKNEFLDVFWGKEHSSSFFNHC